MHRGITAVRSGNPVTHAFIGAHRLGLISDTHGLMRPEALGALRSSDLIIHAGDVGDLSILEGLKRIAPTIAIRGKVDDKLWPLPATAFFEAGPALIYIVHDVNDLDIDPAAVGVQIVVSGHSHRASQTERAGVLYINPGSAGPRRFRLPVSIAKLDLAKRPWSTAFIELKI
ncbi:MAG: metallophosphoesterase family protein [Bryobacteraceae bacterium]